ncbi:lysophospholipid acyltransferase family protein [Acidocella sp.]|uniref:lysophospholipid acyltransferase family protein n=1 Tax=Acidocella sp. TaxID=50710 RepID=UPI003D04843A
MRSFLKSAFAQAFLARILAWYIQAVLRLQFGFRLDGAENLRLLAGDAPMIAAFWHESLPSMPVLLRVARQAGMTRPAVVLASRHRDGQLIGNIMRALGLGLVSGSSSKGGVASMQELVRMIKGGAHVALTPDGPRGPARRAAAGVAALAGLTGAHILPCGAATSRFITLRRSWDNMRIPLPFGRLVLVCGAPVAVPREEWRAALPSIEAALEAARMRAAP